MDRFDAMTAFAVVAELRGFAPAARRLGLSPSAVTRLVAALEERLGIRLLQRTTRSVTLTDAGIRYLERARRILADLEEAEDSAEAERTTPSGRLVVSAPLAFGRIHVGPIMSTYLARYRTVSGELQLNDRIVNLVEEGIDLAVRIGHLADSSLIARRVGATRRVIVAAPRYLKARGVPRTPDDLAAHDIVHFGAPGAAPVWRLRDDRRVVVAPRFATNSAEAAIAHVEDAGGMSLVLAYQVAEAIARRRLRIVLSDYEQPPLPIQIVYPSSRLLSAKVRAFIDLVEQRAAWEFLDP